jgi:hypothetical protein
MGAAALARASKFAQGPGRDGPMLPCRAGSPRTTISTVDASDPRRLVEAPIRHALTSLTARGVLFVVAVSAVILLPAGPWPAAGFGHSAADLAAILVTTTLLGYALLVRLASVVRGRLPDDTLANAWHAAREVEPADAMLALVVAGWVPVALAAALVVMTWPHLNDPNPALRGAWAVLGLPPIVVAWIVATNSWLHACRESLARAEDESRRRFRAYWANAGG